MRDSALVLTPLPVSLLFTSLPCPFVVIHMLELPL